MQMAKKKKKLKNQKMLNIPRAGGICKLKGEMVSLLCLRNIVQKYNNSCQ